MNKIAKTALKIGAGVIINAAVGYVVMSTGGAVDPKNVVRVAREAVQKVNKCLGEKRTELLEDK